MTDEMSNLIEPYGTNFTKNSLQISYNLFPNGLSSSENRWKKFMLQKKKKLNYEQMFETIKNT